MHKHINIHQYRLIILKEPLEIVNSTIDQKLGQPEDISKLIMREDVNFDLEIPIPDMLNGVENVP
jgi:hypothetical protein